jgi:hypothetical protein
MPRKMPEVRRSDREEMSKFTLAMIPIDTVMFSQTVKIS